MAEDSSPSPKKIRVKIVCPKKIIVDTEVDSVQIPAALGMRLIKPRQAPLFCVIKTGQVILNLPQEQKVYLVSCGVCEIRRNICSILAWAVAANDISLEKAQTELESAYALKQTAVIPAAKQEIQKQIDFYKSVIAFVK